MAITDNIPGAKGGDVRQAMKAATQRLGEFMRKEEPLVLDDLADRRGLRRIDAKLAMINYVEAKFRQRTASDGSILAVSKERLIEELTEVVMELEDRMNPVQPIKTEPRANATPELENA